MTTEEMQRALKLSHVPRWSIIDMTKTQTVADHTYRVQAVCLALHQTIEYLVGPFSRGELLQAAFIHDQEEAITGDIPTPAKRYLNLQPKGEPRTLVGLVVKLADLIEAYVFLDRYAIRPRGLMRGHRVYISNAEAVLVEWIEGINPKAVKVSETIRIAVQRVIDAALAYE